MLMFGINPFITAVRERMEIISQRVTAINRGLKPIFFNLSLLRPAPIRKSVPVIRCFPARDPRFQTDSSAGKSDLAAAAAKNPIKNHWNGALLSDLLSFAPPKASGRIHSARVSLTVVPIARASAP